MEAIWGGAEGGNLGRGRVEAICGGDGCNLGRREAIWGGNLGRGRQSGERGGNLGRGEAIWGGAERGNLGRGQGRQSREGPGGGRGRVEAICGGGGNLGRGRRTRGQAR